MKQKNSSLKEVFIRGKIKFLALAGLCLIIIGGIIGMIPLALSNFSFYELYSDPDNPPDMISETVKELPDGISIVVYDIEVSISPSSNGEISMNYDSRSVSYELKNGSLVFKSERQPGILNTDHKWYQIQVDLPPRHQGLELFLPKDYSGSIDVKNDYGTTKIEGIENLGSLRTESSNGTVLLDNMTIEDSVSFSSDYGDVYVENSELKNSMTADSYNGALIVKDCSVGGSLSLSAEYGGINLKNVSCGDVVSAVNESSDISLKNVSAKGGFDIESQYGDCLFDELSGKSLKADLYNGSADIVKTKTEDTIHVVSEYGVITLDKAYAPHMTLFSSRDVNGTVAAFESDFDFVLQVTDIKDTAINENSSYLIYGSEYGNCRLKLEGN